MMVCHVTAWHGTIRDHTAPHGMAWHGIAQHGMAWHSIIALHILSTVCPALLGDLETLCLVWESISTVFM